MKNLKDLLAIVHVDTGYSGTAEILEAVELIQIAQEITCSEADTLIACFYNGPLYDGDVPSKTGRDILLDKQLITRVIVKGEDGYNACNGKGLQVVRLIEAEHPPVQLVDSEPGSYEAY